MFMIMAGMDPCILLWVILLIAFVVGELITVGLTSIWFAAGSLVALLAAVLGANPVVQIILFLAVSLILLILARPVLKKCLNKGVVRTNVNSLMGQSAVVIQKIDNLAQTGQVRINDIEWLARTSDDKEIIPEKTVVTITEVRGVKLIVKVKKED